jgi:hypothetical protein
MSASSPGVTPLNDMETWDDAFADALFLLAQIAFPKPVS